MNGGSKWENMNFDDSSSNLSVELIVHGLDQNEMKVKNIIRLHLNELEICYEHWTKYTIATLIQYMSPFIIVEQW